MGLRSVLGGSKTTPPELNGRFMNTLAKYPHTNSGGRRTVFVVDDHPIMREGLASLINREPDLIVCGQAEDMYTTMESLRFQRPDIMIVDISLKGPDGLELLKAIRASHQQLPVLILSMHDEVLYAERTLRAGANGYVMKQEAAEKVLIALRRILEGEIYVSPRVSTQMLQHYVRGSNLSKASSVTELTDRELEVFRLIGQGHATRQIADELHLSVKTVESYQAHIKEKLVLHNSRELLQHAIQWVNNDKNVA
jgi:DNA-binding NarL/FixJ family response regulator